MALIPLKNEDGSPNEAAAYAHALLILGAYKNDRTPFNLYGTYTGTRLTAFDSNAASFNPDYGVLCGDREALVVLAGTTNTPQWLGHATSAVYPLPDSLVPLRRPGSPLTLGSALLGLGVVELNLDRGIAPIGQGVVNITGHSYGGACAHIYARHLANATNPPAAVNVMTFGEPRHYDGFQARREPDYHARIIAALNVGQRQETLGVDPVTLMPPGVISLGQLGKVVRFLRNVLGFSWHHYGDPFRLEEPGVYRAAEELPALIGLIPGLSMVNVAANMVNAVLHLMGQSYLVKAEAAWRRSGKEPGLAVFDRLYFEYLGTPYIAPRLLGPPVGAAQLNQAFFPPGENPIEPGDEANWEQISAVAIFSPFDGGGAAGMPTKMKGELLLNVADQGASEGWHAQDATTTYAGMQAKLAAITPFRFKLTTKQKSDTSSNELGMVAYRISDDLLQRDTLDIPVATPNQGFADATANLHCNLCCKVVWRSNNNVQIAQTYLHGIPVNALDGLPTDETRKAKWRGSWVTALNNYCAQLQAQGLGFATLNLNPANAMGNITAITYDAGTSQYIVTVSGAVPQGPFRARFARFKSLRVLNGRQSCQSVAANQFRILKQCANHDWDGWGSALPLSGYNNGVVFNNYIIVVPTTCQATLLCTRKLGRPFFLQHGRASRRAA